MATKRTAKRDATRPAARGLWACPKCGQTFVTANVWHSCVKIPVDAHFKDAPPVLRKTFDAFVKAAERNGPVVLRPVKTRIALQAYTRFAAVTVRKSDLACHVVLDHGTPRPPVRRVDKVGNAYVHAFTLAEPADVDGRVCGLLEEAYLADRRRHAHRYK
jgi:Domain of unknown function (DUF5655)